MSFSREVKQEIIRAPFERDCCIAAACYGVACFGKYFDKRGVIFHTEQVTIARYAQQLFEKAGICGKIFVKGTESRRIYEFAVKEPLEVEKTLALLGCSGEETALRIDFNNLNCSGCLRAFAASAFLCCGTITDPQKEYNLEFTLNRRHLAKDFIELMDKRGITLHQTIRKGNQVLYIKASEQIEDMLTFMGAQNAALRLINYKIYKDIRNKANRQTNCETANILKTISANQQCIEDIEYLKETGTLEALPEPLRLAAMGRLEHPEISLAALAVLLDPPVSKSGLCHRMKKLQQIADTQRGQAVRPE
ncbi:MAG: DNA-binding protein WhiA [Oscillospiraceae bacterium]|nr:DNA-binding protein WhiA [Oscillospiraceae bacterium]